jgi:hypothetical protein
MQYLFNPALGSKDHSFAAKSRAESTATRLQNNARNKQKGCQYLNYINDELPIHTSVSIADWSGIVNPVRSLAELAENSFRQEIIFRPDELR